MEEASTKMEKSAIQKSASVSNDIFQYRTIVDSSEDNYLLIDNQSRIVAYNVRAAYSAKFLFGKHLAKGIQIKEFYLENAYERFTADLKKAFTGKTIIRDEKLVLPKKVIWFQLRFFPVFNNRKKVTKVAFHATDITGFKKHKEALKNERRLFEQGPAVTFKWTLFKENSITRFVSPNIASIMGYKPQQLIGKSFLEFIHPQDVQRIKKSIETKVANEIRVDSSFIGSSYRVKCANGKYRWFNDYSFLAVESNDEKLVYGYLIDITEQKEITSQLELKNKELKKALELTKTQSRILEKTTNMVVYTNSECKIKWVNKAFVNTSGYSLDELKGKKFCDLLIDPETDKKIIYELQQALKNKEKITVEMINHSKSGKQFWVEMKMEPIFNKRGEVTAFLSILEDITNRKKIEKQLEGRNKQLKKFSFTTSHELRHEFAKILSLLDNKELLLESGSELSLLQEIETAATNMNSVISKMNGQLLISDSQNIDRIRQLSLADVEEICLIDDDDIVCFINKKMLRSVLPEKTIKTFYTAEDALEYLKNSPDNVKRYLFLDLNMPVMDGWDFLETYKTFQHHSPVIILTSSIDELDRQRGKKYSEVVSFLSKPLTKDKIESLV